MSLPPPYSEIETQSVGSKATHTQPGLEEKPRASRSSEETRRQLFSSCSATTAMVTSSNGVSEAAENELAQEIIPQEALPREILPLSDLRAPHQACKPTCKKEQIRRYIIEIVALTLDASFDAINSALYDGFVVKGTSTILSANERKDLFLLSLEVCKAHRQLGSHGVDEQLKALLREHVMGPGDDLDHQLGGYALDLIGWYGSHGLLRRPPAWEHTIPGYWQSNERVLPPLNEFLCSMRTIKNVIYYASPLNSAVTKVLDSTFEDCRLRCGMGPMNRTCLYLPLRDGYHELKNILYHDWKEYKYAFTLKSRLGDIVVVSDHIRQSTAASAD